MYVKHLLHAGLIKSELIKAMIEFTNNDFYYYGYLVKFHKIKKHKFNITATYFGRLVHSLDYSINLY